MRKEKETLNLECILTDAERIDYSQRLARAINAKRRLEDRLKTASTQIKAEIQKEEAEINLYAEKQESGKENRDVECIIVYDWGSGIRRWIRTDTGEEVKTGAIPEEDLQEYMSFAGEDHTAPVETECEVSDSGPKQLPAPEQKSGNDVATASGIQA